MKTPWTRPECTELKMDAEIGSYHEDDTDRREERFADPRTSDADVTA